jgi:hypothetical protein
LADFGLGAGASVMLTSAMAAEGNTALVARRGGSFERSSYPCVPEAGDDT